MAGTGPPYPLPPPPTGIGTGFEIGTSPIGTPAPFDYWQTLLAQYANSPILVGIISAFQAAADQTADMDNFYALIWDVDTAEGYGLDVWGRIVGVVRQVQAATGKFFGFVEGGETDYDPFGQSPLYGGAALTSVFDLSDDAFRTLILAKALANITDDSIPSLNALLLALFPGRGNCYVVDNGDMSMVWNFEFALTQVEQSILFNSGVLPKPAGVSSSISHL